jgi:hypothetical protein
MLLPYDTNIHLSVRFSDKNFVCISNLSHACYMPAHLIPLDLITVKIFVK